MAMTMHVDIVSAEAEIFSGTATMVYAPAEMGEVAGCEPGAVEEALFGDDLHVEFELGRLSIDEYHQAFCDRIGCRPERRCR